MTAVSNMMMGPVAAAAFVFVQTISANTTDYNLKAAAIAAGWNQLSPLDATVNVNAGVYVSASSTGAYAFDTGVTFPAGTRLRLNCPSAFIVGRGANGGTGSANPNTASGGGAGGPALRAQHPITIDNTGGTIAGGGGGGGGGSTGSEPQDPYAPGSGGYFGGGGGGGGRSGSVNSSGGPGGSISGRTGATGGSGTSSAPGGGGAGSGGSSPPAGAGGSGGQWGASGSGGASTGWNGGPGGAGGNAVVGNNNITWINTGTRLGGIVA